MAGTEGLNKRRKLGLALGAGCARGLAHIGVLQVFEEEGLQIDFLAGTSIGALIGGIYVSGTDLDLMGRLASNLSWNQLVEVGFSRMGLVRGRGIYELLRLLTKDKTFEDVSIPFAAVATDIESGDEVVIKEGTLAEGIMASIAIPGIFVPVNFKDRLLVDGAVVNSLPIRVVQEMGADVVVGVSVEAEKTQGKVRSVIDVILQAIDVMQCELLREKTTSADLLIKPRVGHISAHQIEKAEELVAAGREAALKALPTIKDLLEYDGGS